MTEYITKAQAIHAMEQVTQPECFIEDTRKDFAKIIEKLPAADVAPVVHARWRYVGINWECSCYLFPVPRKSSFYHWCPQCGARMDGDQQCK